MRLSWGVWFSFSSGESFHELRLQLPTRGGDLGEELFVFGQEVVHIAGAGVGVVRILEVVLFLTPPFSCNLTPPLISPRFSG